VLLASRVLVWAAALGAIGLLGVHTLYSGVLDPQDLAQPFGFSVGNLFFAPAARYDSVWYLSIAHAGYFSRQATAFFPLYPLLIHLGAQVFGSTMVVGVLISLGAMVAGGYVLYSLTRLDVGESAARTTILLIAVFPTALFFSAVYTESLFLALSVGAVYAARRERWALAGVLGALASATRSTGLLLLVPLAVMFLYGPRDGGRRLDACAWRRGALAAVPGAWWRPRYALSRSVLWIALVPAGMAVYFLYLGIQHGAPFAPLQAEVYWGRSFAGPFGAAVHAIGRLPDAVSRVAGGRQHPFGPGAPLGWEGYQLVDLPFLAFALGGLWLSLRRLPFAYFAYAFVMCAESLAYPTHVEPMESFSRYLLVIFPVFMGWAALLSSRPWPRRAMVGLLSVGLVAFSALWGTWAWVA
jgi:hypothetical protein